VGIVTRTSILAELARVGAGIDVGRFAGAD